MTELKPNQPIRRFDVFAEYQRLKALDQEKLPPDEAKGYGIWLAKVVAARKFSKTREKEPGETKTGQPKQAREELVDQKWRSLDGIPQTDALFDREIIRRMGDDFYTRVFSPAIRQAYEKGEDYTKIRDTLRKNWKP